MRRSTRSQTRKAAELSASPSTSHPQPLPQLNTASTIASPTIATLASTFTSKTTGLSRKSTTLLKYKRAKLRTPNTQLTQFIQDTKNPPALLVNAINATLIFAQEEAGTAVCISSNGLLLTCSHCVAEDAATALNESTFHWLITATGEVVKAICVFWDAHRDLALLRIVAAEPPALESLPTPSSPSRTFSYVTLSPLAPPPSTSLLCIGHPGSEDLEASTPGVSTGYDVLHISSGKYRGLSPGQDPQDNSEIGALMHDCWTYWGHSGAPLVERRTGGLVGLHSSWDEETGMRRGVAWEAVQAFLEEHTTLGKLGERGVLE